MRRILILVLLAAILQACGSKGPLYLPPGQTQVEPQSPQPIDIKSKSR
ncbi:MAG: lipoprotein [Pseudomonadota bacterium]|nr:MAG: hypothetical protein DIU74_07230 [Pseudomonadota bacterium]